MENKIEEAKRCYRADQFDECVRTCQKILSDSETKDADRLTVLHLLGDAFLDLEKYEDAIAAYTSLIGLTKSDIAFANRGFAQIALGRWNLALADYLEAIRLSPANIVAMEYAAECYIQLGQHQKAVNLLVCTSIDMTTKRGKIYRVLGLAYSKLEMWSEAYNAFYEAVERDANDSFSQDAMKSIERLASEDEG